jgi:hypothetical protein
MKLFKEKQTVKSCNGKMETEKFLGIKVNLCYFI